MKSKDNIHLALWFFLCICMIVIPISAYGLDGQVEIKQTPGTNFPIIIDQPGNYLLTSNIKVSTPKVDGIQIMASDVSLDLHGHTLSGSGKSSKGTGIYASCKENIEIVNGEVGGFLCGISLCGPNHQVKNLDASHNSSIGIKADLSTIINCTANSNGSYGIKANSCTIANCTASSNSFNGLEADSCTIINCKANSNGAHGINAMNKCRIEKNTLNENGGYGLYLESDNSYTIKNLANNNLKGNFYQKGLNYIPTKGDDANLKDRKKE